MQFGCDHCPPLGFELLKNWLSGQYLNAIQLCSLKTMTQLSSTLHVNCVQSHRMFALKTSSSTNVYRSS